MAAKKPEPRDRSNSMFITLQPEQRVKLRRYCKREERSPSWVLDRLVRDHITT